MSRSYDAGRHLSNEAAAAWRVALRPYVAGARAVLDVGAGTGRFALLLAGSFDARVAAIEPARGMLSLAKTHAGHPAVVYAAGRAEELPLQGDRFDVALLSNVYHHIADKRRSADELRRVLRSGARVLIRGAFGDRLGEITLFDYFPEARLVCEQFPTLDDAVTTFAASGFRLESVRRVVQTTCIGLQELAARTRLRADTTLALMTDDEFSARQRALEIVAAREARPAPITDTLDLVVLRKV